MLGVGDDFPGRDIRSPRHHVDGFIITGALQPAGKQTFQEKGHAQHAHGQTFPLGSEKHWCIVPYVPAARLGCDTFSNSRCNSRRMEAPTVTAHLLQYCWGGT
jgi:hypothetical protein